jgi:transcriptional regulator with XRE-family HTH domain
VKSEVVIDRPPIIRGNDCWLATSTKLACTRAADKAPKPLKFGTKFREVRKGKKLGQRALAGQVGVSFTYVSKIENERLGFGDYPSEEVILRLARALDADADELLLLAEKIPEAIKWRVLRRPDALRRLAMLDGDGPRLGYVRYLLDEEGRFDYIKENIGKSFDKFNSHMPMLETYRGMLMEWERSPDKYHLTRDDLMRITARA